MLTIAYAIPYEEIHPTTFE